MIRDGIGRGFGSSAPLGVTDLVLFEQELWGAALQELWIGDSCVFDGSNHLTAWVGNHGSNALSISGNYFNRVRVNGRAGVVASSSAEKYLHNDALPSSVCLLAVTTGIATPAAFQQALLTTAPADVGGPAAALIVGGGASTWYTDGGWSHYVNSVASEGVLSSLHAVECRKASNTVGKLRVGSWPGQQCYSGGIFLIRSLLRTPTPTESSKELAMLERYYRY